MRRQLPRRLRICVPVDQRRTRVKLGHPAPVRLIPSLGQKGTSKLTNTLAGLGLIQMGARVQAPSLERCLCVDMVEGGVDNSYVYPIDPIDCADLNGQFRTKLFPTVCSTGEWFLGVSTLPSRSLANASSAEVLALRVVDGEVAQGIQ